MVEGITFEVLMKRQRRDVLDLRQWELARLVGCATSTIHAWETGARRPSKEFAEELAEHLEIPPEERAAFVRLARTRRAHHPDGREIQPYSEPVPTAIWGWNVALVRDHLSQRPPRAVTLWIVTEDDLEPGSTRIEAVATLVDELPDGALLVALAPTG